MLRTASVLLHVQLLPRFLLEPTTVPIDTSSAVYCMCASVLRKCVRGFACWEWELLVPTRRYPTGCNQQALTKLNFSLIDGLGTEKNRINVN